MHVRYYEVRFDTKGKDQDTWMALLSEWPFDSFHQDGDELIGYIQQSHWHNDLLNFIEKEKGSWYNSFEYGLVPDKNWNAEWESSFHPVVVDDFCYIRAEFHQPAPPGFKHEVIIAPKMAFGTGHHATTFMMIQAMSSIDLKGKYVLDYGCGTGILSVVAAKEGAEKVIGIDIQTEAIENSIEHAVLNQVSTQCEFLEGDLSILPPGTYDILLANINTKIIIDSFEQMKLLLAPRGIMLLSGIMKDHLEELEKGIDIEAFQKEMHYREDWVQITLK